MPPGSGPAHSGASSSGVTPAGSSHTPESCNAREPSTVIRCPSAEWAGSPPTPTIAAQSASGQRHRRFNTRSRTGRPKQARSRTSTSSRSWDSARVPHWPHPTIVAIVSTLTISSSDVREEPVISDLTMSLDGFVADPSDRGEQLFKWYSDGQVPVTMPGDSRTLRVSAATANHLNDTFSRIGAVVSGLRTFDLTDGWRGGHHPAGVPVFVVTHSVPDGWPRESIPFSFVTDGVEHAVTQASGVAGDGIVFVGSTNIARQCLTAGMLDELRINLVPVLLGEGVRLFADRVATVPPRLGEPTVIQGKGVTHLCYRLRKSSNGIERGEEESSDRGHEGVN